MFEVGQQLNNAYSNNTILKDAIKNNGRVNISLPSRDTQFKMMEKIALKNKSNDYTEALNGSWEDNALSNTFFSKENIQIIQNGIRAGVYKISNQKYVVPPQNIDTLKIIMRSIFYQYVEYDMQHIKEQITKLNGLVLQYCIHSVYNECVGYSNYVKDISTLVVPIDLPKHHDRNYKQLELRNWF